ncbi:transglycosylase domain-containing protein [Devriesea agamarum]|uniref:transglycosylase domain-containing protein n=1 Tax=Devriesea agamarum TaxID=472569 RepID=UPI000AEFDEC0|nr:transglycosylase domain-containing protein [Devriesea agamarum]
MSASRQPNRRASRASGSQSSRHSSRTAPRESGAAAPAARGRGSRGERPKKNLLNYPRAGKKNPWRWLPSWRLIFTACVLGVLAVAGLFTYLYVSVTVPKPTDIALAQTSTVYYADGTTKMGTFSEVNRTIIPDSDIPQSVKNAIVASEDSTFYENRGISPKGILRALVNNLSGGARQGASTITQQYVENYYSDKKTTTYWGKAKEAMMAIKADQQLSKDEILSRYLNTIYFGRGAYGIQQAAQVYFGKDAKNLDDSEAAMLIGIIPAPSVYDPAKNPSKAKQRWERVINREVNETKVLSPEKAKTLTFPATIPVKSENTFAGTRGYLLASIRKELAAKGIPEDELNTGGFKIVSTIDQNAQDAATKAVGDLPYDRPKLNHVGTITIDPKTGAIVSMYGGADYLTQPRNDATQSRMQAGSIFKLFTLVAALKQGVSLDSMWPGNGPQEFNGWKVSNFDKAQYGYRISLLRALEKSSNTAFAALNLKVGPDATRRVAIDLGLSEKTPGLNSEPTNVLGTASPTVEEMAEAYATIASGGIHRDPHIVVSVTNPDGSVRYKFKDDGKRVIDEGVATNAMVALQGPTSSGGTANYIAKNFKRPVAGKTGTSDSFRSAWFVGFTPQYVTAVGMYQPTPDGKGEATLTPFGGFKSITGGTLPPQIWVEIMDSVLKGQPVEDFPDRVYGGSQSKDRSSEPTAPRSQSPTSTPSESVRPTTPEPTDEVEPVHPTDTPTRKPVRPTIPSVTPSRPAVQPTERPEPLDNDHRPVYRGDDGDD